MKEIWKEIKGYEGKYKISNKGNVISLKFNNTNNGRLLKNQKQKTGYNAINLYKNNVRKLNYVHRLVAEAFIPNPNNKPQVNHINFIRDDNRIENLEWVTNQENCNHSYKNRKRYTIFNNPLNKPVIQFTKEGIKIKEFISITIASKETGIDNCHIGSVCNGKRKSAGGFIWKFKK